MEWVVLLSIPFLLGYFFGWVTTERRINAKNRKPMCLCDHPITTHVESGCRADILFHHAHGRPERMGKCACQGYEGPPGRSYNPPLPH